MSYTNLLYHIVCATKERAPLITKALRPRLHETKIVITATVTVVVKETLAGLFYHPRIVA